MMTREWQAGDVAVITVPAATVSGSELSATGWVEEWAFRDHDRGWRSLRNPDYFWSEGYSFHNADPRPLIVIDPADLRSVERLLDLYATACRSYGDSAPTRDLDPLVDALREFANPTPPRPDEPTGLGAVVEDADGERWIRHEHDPGRRDRRHAWYVAGYVSKGTRVTYDEIDAVKVLHAGWSA